MHWSSFWYVLLLRLAQLAGAAAAVPGSSSAASAAATATSSDPAAMRLDRGVPAVLMSELLRPAMLPPRYNSPHASGWLVVRRRRSNRGASSSGRRDPTNPRVFATRPSKLPRVQPLRIVVHRGDVDEATHLRACRRGARRRRGRAGGRRRPRRLSAFLGEAVPGAAARARARRPDDRGDRDRVRVAPRLARAARGRAQPAREGAGRRGRARVRSGADRASAQLLGQARRHARALP